MKVNAVIIIAVGLGVMVVAAVVIWAVELGRRAKVKAQQPSLSPDQIEKLEAAAKANLQAVIEGEVSQFKGKMDGITVDAERTMQGLPEAMQQRFDQIINKFDQELAGSSEQISASIKKLATSVIVEELEHYQKSLEDLRTSAVKSLKDATGQIEQQSQSVTKALDEQEQRLQAAFTSQVEELTSGLKAELESQKQRLAASESESKQRIAEQLETKLSDLVTSYLTDVLGKEVDLGAQSKYMLARLEEHKADLKRELLSEV